MEDPDEKFVEGEVCIVKAKPRGYDFLPCIPARHGDETLELKDGILLNCLGLVEVQPGSWFYKMEVVTGKQAGDMIFVGYRLADLLEKVPNHHRLR